MPSQGPCSRASPFHHPPNCTQNVTVPFSWTFFPADILGLRPGSQQLLPRVLWKVAGEHLCVCGPRQALESRAL